MNSFSDSYITQCIQPFPFHPYFWLLVGWLVGHLAHFLSKLFGGYFTYLPSPSHCGWSPASERMAPESVGFGVWLPFLSLDAEWVCEADICVACEFVLLISGLGRIFHLFVCFSDYSFGGKNINLSSVLGLKFRMCFFAPSYILYTIKELAP